MQEPHLYLPGTAPSDPPRPRPSQAQASQGLTRPHKASQGLALLVDSSGHFPKWKYNYRLLKSDGQVPKRAQIRG